MPSKEKKNWQTLPEILPKRKKAEKTLKSHKKIMTKGLINMGPNGVFRPFLNVFLSFLWQKGALKQKILQQVKSKIRRDPNGFAENSACLPPLKSLSFPKSTYGNKHTAFFYAFILWNNKAVVHLCDLWHAGFHVLCGPRPQDAGHLCFNYCFYSKVGPGPPSY
jgi:hypothetical protein